MRANLPVCLIIQPSVHPDVYLADQSFRTLLSFYFSFLMAMCKFSQILFGLDCASLAFLLFVTEHLLMVLIMTNLTSLDAGVLIMVRHMLLNMFFLVMMDSSMLVLSLSTWSGSSSWLPKCHVWHINQNPTIDRHLLVIVLGPKMHFYRILPML